MSNSVMFTDGANKTFLFYTALILGVHFSMAIPCTLLRGFMLSQNEPPRGCPMNQQKMQSSLKFRIL